MISYNFSTYHMLHTIKISYKHLCLNFNTIAFGNSYKFCIFHIVMLFLNVSAFSSDLKNAFFDFVSILQVDAASTTCHSKASVDYLQTLSQQIFDFFVSFGEFILRLRSSSSFESYYEPEFSQSEEFCIKVSRDRGGRALSLGAISYFDGKSKS